MAYIERNRIKTGEFWGQTPIWSDPDITNRDKNCVNKSEVRPRYS